MKEKYLVFGMDKNGAWTKFYGTADGPIEFSADPDAPETYAPEHWKLRDGVIDLPDYLMGGGKFKAQIFGGIAFVLAAPAQRAGSDVSG